jgi:hypothetical protein
MIRERRRRALDDVTKRREGTGPRRPQRPQRQNVPKTVSGNVECGQFLLMSL